MAEVQRRLPSLDLLKGFESAARHLNFTHAADELYLTQSAVSRQIQTLEENLGVRLFVRQRRGLTLTAEGLRLREAVQGALGHIRETIDSLAPRNAPRGITVTSTMAFSSLWLIPRVGRFQQLHPDVDVRISANDRVLDLDREHVDVSVRYVADASAPPPDGRWLFREELVPICSPRLLERTGKSLDQPEDLRHHVLLRIEDPTNPALWLSWNSWFEATGVRRVKPAGSIAFNYFDQLMRAALAGHGVALGRLPLIQEYLDEGSVIAPFGARVPSRRSYWLIIAPTSRGRPEVERFADWLAAETAGNPTGNVLAGSPKRKRRT
jgi:LysR family transcriptional regulator, glycine cleavage system transcriptional activator